MLGGSGYVAGEIPAAARAHPRLTLGAVVSTSQAGEPIATTFAAPRARVSRRRSSCRSTPRSSGCARRRHWLVLSAAPHGASAQLVEQLLGAADAGERRADRRRRFGGFSLHRRGARSPKCTATRIRRRRASSSSRCAVPEHLARIDTPHAAHPGCFATTMLLAIVPLARAGSARTTFYVSAVTGSTGAGRTPRETTHHPVRQSNLFAYQALKHRHDPEVRALAEGRGRPRHRSQLRAAFGPVRARHSRDDLRAPKAARDERAGRPRRSSEYYRDSRVRARRGRAAASEGHRRDELLRPCTRSPTATRSSSAPCSTICSRARRAAASNGRIACSDCPKTIGLTAPAAGWL